MDDNSELNKLSGKKTFPPVTVVTMLALTTFFGALSSFSPASLIGVILIALASAITAFIMSAVNLPLSLISLPLAYGAAFAVSGSWSQSLPALIYFPCALMIFFSCRRKYRRSCALVAISVGLGVAAAAYLMLDVYLTQGNLSITALKDYYDSFYADLLTNFTTVGITEEIASQALGYVMPLLPSVAVIMLEIVAYTSTAIYGAVCRLFRFEEKCLPANPWSLELSVVSAYMLIASFVVTAVTAISSPTLIYMVSLNFAVILAPGFCVIGARAFRENIKKRGAGALNVIMIVVAFAMLFLNFVAFVAMLAFLGAADILIKYYLPKIKNNMNDD